MFEMILESDFNLFNTWKFYFLSIIKKLKILFKITIKRTLNIISSLINSFIFISSIKNNTNASINKRILKKKNC